MSVKDELDTLKDNILFLRTKVEDSRDSDLKMNYRENSYNSDYRKLRRKLFQKEDMDE